MERKFSDKTFYKISEVSEMTKLAPSVLRFWESQFSFLRPKKSQGRHRVYDKRTIETVLEIKRMLYEEGYTIPGLKRYWRHHRGKKPVTPSIPSGQVQHIRSELQCILGTLNSYSQKTGPTSHPH